MFVTIGIWIIAVVGVMNGARNIDISLLPSMLIDLFLVYVLGAYLGVLPAVV